MKSKVIWLGALAGGVLALGVALAHEGKMPTGKVKGQMDAIQRMLDKHPEMIIDLSNKSGEYCINTWKVGGGHMTHYAIDPSKTSEDVIDFVKLDSFPGNVDVTKLPRMPSEMGAMEPGQWYYLEAGSYEPHHQTRFSYPLLVRATNVQ